MDTKQLVDKFINGEIDEEMFDAEVSKLTPEEQEKIKEEAKNKLPDAVEKLKGVRRGIDKISQENLNKDVALATKIQKENLEEAKTQFYAKYEIEKEEDRKVFEQDFKTDSIGVSNIMKDLKAHYVAKNPDKYLELEEKQRAREKEAEEINAQNAGANGSSGGDDPTKKVSKEVKDFIEASRKMGRNITIEQAERALKVVKDKGHIR